MIMINSTIISIIIIVSLPTITVHIVHRQQHENHNIPQHHYHLNPPHRHYHGNPPQHTNLLPPVALPVS